MSHQSSDSDDAPANENLGVVAARIRAIADRTADPDLRALAEEVEAVEDRLCFAEAEILHIKDRLDNLSGPRSGGSG